MDDEDDDGEGRREKGRGAKMLHTDIQTYRHTDRTSDEAGPRGAFAPNNLQNAI